MPNVGSIKILLLPSKVKGFLEGYTSTGADPGFF